MPVGRSPVLSRRNSAAVHGSADGDMPGQHAENTKDVNIGGKRVGKKDAGNQALELHEAVRGDGAVGESAGSHNVDSGEVRGGARARHQAGMEQNVPRPTSIGKLDESMYRMFEQESVSSLSRSSSDTSSTEAVCSGGQGKPCGNPVKEGEAGVLCDKCHDWFHASCQGIPKAAIKALERFDSLAWLCANCKSDLKGKKPKPPSMSSLLNKLGQLEEAVQKNSEMIVNAVQAHDKSVKDHSSQMEKSLKSFEEHASNQIKSLEKSALQYKSSYAEVLKGTCTEVAHVVKAQMDKFPRVGDNGDRRAAVDLSKVLDDHLDKEKRKANIVIHNLPEQSEGTVVERCEKDSASFVTMIKDEMKLNATVSKSFRVGKKLSDKPRLLIVTLDNPAVKQDILRYASQLRHSEQYSNIYVTPDLTQKEREANRKLREELASRRRSGEANLMIKGGKIISMNRMPTSRPDEHATTTGSEAPNNQPARGAPRTAPLSSTVTVAQDGSTGTKGSVNSAAGPKPRNSFVDCGKGGGPVDRPEMDGGPAAKADPEVVAAHDCGRDHTSQGYSNAADEKGVVMAVKPSGAVALDHVEGSTSLGQPGVAGGSAVTGGTGSGADMISECNDEDVSIDQLEAAVAPGHSPPVQSASPQHDGESQAAEEQPAALQPSSSSPSSSAQGH